MKKTYIGIDAKSQLEHFKSFFGQKHIVQESEKNSTEDAEVQNVRQRH